MTEIQWLVDIILHHKLPGPLMEKFVARIGEVEALLMKPNTNSQPMTLKPQAPAPLPVENIAHSVVASQALASREQAIMAGMSGKAEPGRTGPRKF